MNTTITDKTSDIRLQWFAMSATFRRELKARALLDDAGIECFIPMKYMAVTKRNGRKAKELVPAVHNLIFVHADKEQIQDIKKDIPWLQWLTRSSDGRNVPIVVPDRDMEQFIQVTRDSNEKLVYLRPDEIDLRKGTPIRILGGPFNGIEGTFIKIQGHRNRRVVVMLKNIIGVAMAEVTPDLIESRRPLRHNNLKICIPLFDGDGLVAATGERLGIGTGTLMG